jgi:formylglycine-generating enzyme required for sulfatase activity
LHTVTINRQIAVGKFEVSHGEFSAFIRGTGYRTEAELSIGCKSWNGKEMAYDKNRNWRTPGFSQADDHPVVCITWNDAQSYVDWLNKQVPKISAHKKFRLLTESEWEYSARAKQGNNRFPWGEDPNYSSVCLWGNSSDKTLEKEVPKNSQWLFASCSDTYAFTAPGTAFAPNAFGLNNLHGNVWEWVQDRWHLNYIGAPDDGTAWESGPLEQRVLRGGSWNFSPKNIRSADRIALDPSSSWSNIGFRVARDL